MAKFKEYHQDQIMLLPPSLDEKVPADHLARHISAVVDQLDLSGIEDSYSSLGCHAYHPAMLIKVILYAYSLGLRSSRRIQKEIREDLVFMWLAGRQEPDFRTISDFRKSRLGDIKQLFNQVLSICRELGMVKCGKVSIDGTKIEANSGKHKITYRKTLEKARDAYEDTVERILDEAERVDAEEDRLYANRDGYSLDRPFSADEIRKAVGKVKRQKEKIERDLEKAEAKLAGVEEKLERMGEQRNSFGNTDPDATLMMMKEGSLGIGYNVQLATEEQVIVGYGVYQRPNDNHLLRPMIEEVEKNLGVKPQTIVADKGYCSQANYEYVVQRQIETAIPPQSYDQDRAARRKGTYKYSQNLAYEKLKLQMMDFLETDRGRELIDRRKHDIEPTFGDIKHNMTFRKLLLRGIPKVNVEVGLVAIAHNLKKMRCWLPHIWQPSVPVLIG